MNERNNLEVLRVDGKIILPRILNQQDSKWGPKIHIVTFV